MRDIGTSAGETTDMDQLEEFMLELAIDNTGADAGMLMDVVDGMQVPNKSQGYFPPPMSLRPWLPVNENMLPSGSNPIKSLRGKVSSDKS